VGLRVGLDTEARGDRTSIARSSSPQPDTILTEHPAHILIIKLTNFIKKIWVNMKDLDTK
jgi:hypothetical protein